MNFDLQNIGHFKWFMLAALIAIFFCYWLLVRPAWIYKSCNSIAAEKAIEEFHEYIIDKQEELTTKRFYELLEADKFFPKDYEFYYKQCLRKHGMKQ